MNAACETMIQQQLRTNGITDKSLFSLYRDFPREAFVPDAYRAFAYSDARIPLPFEQCMFTPLEEATLLQTLALNGSETVLEVGTGTGFLTVLLSQLCKKVYTVDYFEAFTQSARQRFETFQLPAIDCLTGDATQLFETSAPYDVVLYSGVLPALTDMHRLQVVPGGQLIAFIGTPTYAKAMHYQLDHHKIWTETVLFETALPALITSQLTSAFIF